MPSLGVAFFLGHHRLGSMHLMYGERKLFRSPKSIALNPLLASVPPALKWAEGEAAKVLLRAGGTVVVDRVRFVQWPLSIGFGVWDGRC